MLCILDTQDVAGGQMMAATDPPRHTALRAPIHRAFTRDALEAHLPQIRAAVQSLLEPALDGEPWDFAAAAMSFPTRITGTMMGLPEADWPLLARLTTMAIAYEDPEFQEGGAQETLSQSHLELFTYFSEQLLERRRSPAEDLIQRLMAIEIEGERLTDEEVIFNCYSLLLGANVTTPHSATALVMALAENPDQYDELMHDPGTLLAGAVEEGLRWSSPANHFMRYARHDTELRGVRIARGDAVSAWLGSANRDEDVFESPYKFDVRRRPNPHVAFGFGSHYCVGAPLARLALRELLAEVLRRTRRLEVVSPARHLASNFVAGVKHLEVVMHPRPDIVLRPSSWRAREGAQK
jgi:cytochrome P450